MGVPDAAHRAPIAPHELAALVTAATDAKANAYAPYSKFRVGAALLAADGAVFYGANVENCSYGLTICAERSAICQAAARGARAFRAVAVATDTAAGPVFPCGACRQVLAEFGPMHVISVSRDGQLFEADLCDLLPNAFTPAQLMRHVLPPDAAAKTVAEDGELADDFEPGPVAEPRASPPRSPSPF